MCHVVRVTGGLFSMVYTTYRESSLTGTTHLTLRILSGYQVAELEVSEACRGSAGTLQAALFTPNTGYTSH